MPSNVMTSGTSGRCTKPVLCRQCRPPAQTTRTCMLSADALQGCMRIRHFEWLDSVRHLNGEVSRYGVDDGEGVLASRLDAEQHILMPARPVGADSTAAVTQADSAAQDALQLPTDEQFEACTDLCFLRYVLLIVST